MTMLVNALASYGRLLFCAALGLLSSRWIFLGLGEEDFGLFAVIGGITGFLAFISNTLAGSVQRHFSYAMGQGHIRSIQLWFNSALCIHLCFAALILLVGIPFGFWMIFHVLNIPPERIRDCVLSFFCVLGMTTLHIASVPFISTYIARQRIFELSLFAIGTSVLNAVLALWLLYASWNRFLLYSVGLLAINFLGNGVQILRAELFFPECRIRPAYWFHLRRIRELLSFAGWSLFGVLGNLGRSQGMIFLVNIFWGAKVNAAFGIANQIGGQTEQVSAGLFGAIAPEITASAGRGEKKRVLQLSLLASKYSMFLSLLVLVPLLFRLEQLLNLWLRNPPPFTAELCWIVLGMFFIEKLTSGYMVMVNAYGSIAGYQATLGGFLLLTLPLSWLLHYCGAGVVITVGGMLVTTLACALGRIWWVWHLQGVSPLLWLQKVLGPMLKVVIPISLLCLLLDSWFSKDLFGLLLTWVIFPIITLGLIWLLGLGTEERAFLLEKAKEKVFNRIHIARGMLR